MIVIVFMVLGADFYALAADAYSIATHRLIEEFEQIQKQQQQQQPKHDVLEEYKRGTKKTIVEVCEDDFIRALANLTPSVSPQELERFKKIQQKFGK
jgi:SpoVK/Ycf46/Vps4 family AAA+-type ATPase